MTDLSEKTREIIRRMFPVWRRNKVAKLLVTECGDNLPFQSGKDETELERFRFAVLKLSGGNMNRLRAAIALAQEDWRDLLIEAGFAESFDGHARWAKEYLGGR